MFFSALGPIPLVGITNAVPAHVTDLLSYTEVVLTSETRKTFLASIRCHPSFHFRGRYRDITSKIIYPIITTEADDLVRPAGLHQWPHSKNHNNNNNNTCVKMAGRKFSTTA
ncbi:hypothetical protein B0T09DRAFT_332080 [Sordaria sp. MPI-SDFR-AT-0083]|nr:hypothetical protein B0T09DRAFT_332080 [Sordaria sp. MPI-SDFR-AT-0083]